MKLASLLNIVVFNAAALVMAALVYDDRVWRLGYWQSLGFSPTTNYFPLFFITSAVKGSTSIAGVLTVDWLQVIVLIVVVVDAATVVGAIRRRGGHEPPAAPPAGKPAG